MKTYLKAVLVSTAIVLAACGSEEPAAPTPTPVVRKPAEIKPADPTAKMARGVAAGGKATAPVELKYDILSKPEPGKPIEVALALIPGSVVDSMTVNVTATPGLEVLKNASGNFGVLQINEVANHTVTVRADRAEVVYLTVSASLVSVGITSVRAFAVPLIFTDPAVAAAGAPATTDAQAKPDATGQKVQSMPAQESKK